MWFMQFSAIFIMLGFLAALVTCGIPLEGWEWGCYCSMPVLGSQRAFLVASSIDQGRSWPWCCKLPYGPCGSLVEGGDWG